MFILVQCPRYVDLSNLNDDPRIYMCVYTYVCVCMHVCVSVCMHACVRAMRVRVCMHLQVFL